MDNPTRAKKRIAIVGGGLVGLSTHLKKSNLKKTPFFQVGSLNACFFAQKGFPVDLYECREGQ
jgi:uncharacterized protein with NAD-binding domain and iron-sulfur cluster